MASRSIYYESSESDDVDQQSTTGESRGLPVVKTKRRRGRPRGNPQPLNAEERRLRNAQYERERRNEMADAMRMLAEAAGFDDKVSNVNLLASVLSRLRNAETHPPEEISELRRKNALIERQILEAESRLASEDMTAADESVAPTSDTAQRVVGRSAVIRPRIKTPCLSQI